MTERLRFLLCLAVFLFPLVSFLREVIHEAEAGRPEVGPVRAHSIRGLSTSAAFHRNWSVASVLESATWRSNLVFVSFYLRDL